MNYDNFSSKQQKEQEQTSSYLMINSNVDNRNHQPQSIQSTSSSVVGSDNKQLMGNHYLPSNTNANINSEKHRNLEEEKKPIWSNYQPHINSSRSQLNNDSSSFSSSSSSSSSSSATGSRPHVRNRKISLNEN